MFVFIWYKVIIALSLCLSSGALQYIAHTSIVAAKIVSLKFFFETQYFGPDLRLAQTKTAMLIRSVQNADCRPRTKCRLGTKCRLQTGYKMQTEFILFFGLIRDNMSSYNLPSVTQSLFRDHLSRLFAYIPCPFLDHKHRIY